MIFFINTNKNVISLLAVVLLTMTGIGFAEDNNIRRRGIVRSPLLSMTPMGTPPTILRQQPKKERRRGEGTGVDDSGEEDGNNEGGNGINNQKFWFDCHVPDEHNLDTTDMLVGYFYDSDGNYIDSQEKQGGIRCTEGSANYFNIRSSSRVDHARLIIVSPSDDEGDSLFIDYAWLTVNGVEEEWWDEDDSQGWCLSTEADDVVTGGWRDNAHWNYCVEDLCFLPNGIVEDGNACYSRDTIKFYFECNEESLIETHTDDVVTVYFHDNNGDIIDSQDISGGISCNRRESFEVLTNVPVDYVRLVIEGGGDALWIDRAWLKVNDNIVKHWGSQNDELGWCLSTDPEDVSNNNWGDHAVWTRCEDQICFFRNNGVTRGENCGTSTADIHQQFGFDCHVPGESHTDTTDLVLVYFKDSNGNVIGYSSDSRIRCERDSENNFDIWSPRRTNAIEMTIETPGGGFNSETGGYNSDALFIDHAWLLEDNVEVYHWDRNDNWGFCLSTDSEDMGSWNRYRDECFSTMCFGPDNVVVPGECSD